MKNSHETGQALPLGIALILAVMITGVVLFNTGQVVNDKTRLANAADSAVYSGITWQARALNFNAYTNRAMIANQVAIAQAVSLQSWAQYARTSGNNLGTALSPVPIVGQIAAATQKVMNAIEPVMDAFGKGILLVVDPVNTALSKAQEAMYLSAFVASPQLIGKVASANDSRMTWESAFSVMQAGSNLRSWQNFSEQFEPEDEVAMDERIAMINASTDPFTKKRSWEFFDRYLPLTPLHWARLDRSGTTRLLRDRESGETEWKAIDTLSLNNKYYYFFGRYRRFEIPIGYSLKYASEQDESLESCTAAGPNRCEDWFGRNKYAQHLARHVERDLAGDENEARSDVTYKGVRAYRSLSDAIRRDQNPSILLRTELRMPLTSISDSNSLNIAASYVNGVENSTESVISSVSSSEVYFKRPGDDASEEFASGYNPFWSVRLAPTTNEARTVAMLSRGSSAAAIAPTMSLAVYNSSESVDLPSELGGNSDLARWSPSLVGESESVISSSMNLTEDLLSDVFENVLDGLLSGIFPGGLQEAENISSNALDGVDVGEIQNTVATIEGEIDELRERYRNARDEIRARFLEAANELIGDTNSRRDQINAQIAALTEELGPAGAEREEEIQSEILALQVERDGLNGEGGLDSQLRENLAQVLVDIVEEVVPEFPLPYSQALFMVDQFLNSAEDVTDQLQIFDFADEEDDPNE